MIDERIAIALNSFDETVSLLFPCVRRVFEMPKAQPVFEVIGDRKLVLARHIKIGAGNVPPDNPVRTCARGRITRFFLVMPSRFGSDVKRDSQGGGFCMTHSAATPRISQQPTGVDGNKLLGTT